jgi:hypothetical protein
VRLGERPFLIMPFPVCLWRRDGSAAVDGEAPAGCRATK